MMANEDEFAFHSSGICQRTFFFSAIVISEMGD